MHHPPAQWGLPIPVFYCKDCGKPICTDETIDAVSRSSRRRLQRLVRQMTAEEILPEGFACPHCGQVRGFDQETDTLDGWFDSGSTHFASMKSARRASGPPPCIWRALTSTVVGSSPRC